MTRSIHKILLTLILLVTFSANANIASKVTLKQGVNLLDINSDNGTDIVIYGIFDNNTSHPNKTMTILIKNNHEYNIVPLPHGEGFTWSDFSLSASTIKISDYQLYQQDNRYFIVSAYKVMSEDNGQDISDNLPVKFSRYDIKLNNDDPGVSRYHWELSKSYVTKTNYIDTDEAFNHLDLSQLQ